MNGVFGPRPGHTNTTFRIWAPAAQDVSLECDGTLTALGRCDDGFWTGSAPVRPGARYRFLIDGHVRVADPASRAQETDADGWSVVVDPQNYSWRCADWRGRPWEEVVLYEAHAGLLGGFEGVARELPRLAQLGITAIELMPIADFPGRRNWGYDGVLPFAPDRAYGTPDDLKALIDRAHAHGLMVFLDVVYNHFGPEGNRLHAFAPQFFRDDIHTPWGSAIDFRQPAVSRFFIENALYWICEYRFDGLRFDAVHAISDRTWLRTLAKEIRATVPRDRHVHLVVENDNNDSGLLADGFDAQWNDDFHHAVHVLLTGESEGYYVEYSVAPAKSLARILSEGFAWQGEPSPHRGGEPRGQPTTGLPPTAFVNFLQNHDQTGNRAFGERLTQLADPAALRAAVALQLLVPQIPLIFMGEESGSHAPFLFFTDFPDELAEKVREGRRAEFARFSAFADPSTRTRIPDPNAQATFDASRPDFCGEGASGWTQLYTDILRIRREHVIPHLRGSRACGAEAIADAVVIARWRLGNGSLLTVASNLGAESVSCSLPDFAPLWGEASRGLPAFTTCAWIGS